VIRVFSFDKKGNNWFLDSVMSKDPQLNFFAGLEEAFARFFSAVFTILLFVVFALGNMPTTTNLSTVEIIIYLGLFWLVYESISYLFFFLFNFFTRRGQGVSMENGESKLANPDSNQVDSFTNEQDTAKK
jgi:hypothetical protein